MNTAYLDNNIVCGVTKNDLPAGESDALTTLLMIHDEGRIRVVTSEVTRQEMEKWKGKDRSPAERVFYLLEKVEFIPDHALLGFHNQWDRTGGASVPLVEDDPISSELRSIGLDRTDAHHLMLAIRGSCDYFVTCDERTILKHRAAVMTRFPSVKLLSPSELVRELTATR